MKNSARALGFLGVVRKLTIHNLAKNPGPSKLCALCLLVWEQQYFPICREDLGLGMPSALLIRLNQENICVKHKCDLTSILVVIYLLRADKWTADSH